MNKLDNIVDMIFEDIGEIKNGRHSKNDDYEGYWGLLDKNDDLICYKLPAVCYVTEHVPHIEMLNNVLNEESFEYIMNEVGNRLADLHPTKEPMKYYGRIYPKYRFKYVYE